MLKRILISFGLVGFVALVPLAHAQQLTPELLDQMQKASKGGRTLTGQATRGVGAIAPAEDKGRTTIISKPAQTVDRKTPFESYVNTNVGLELARFGSELVKEGEQTFAPSSNYVVPNDYVIGPGDELLIRAWGSLDLDLAQVVDRRGRINLPVVGELSVAGQTYGTLEKTIRAKMGRAFREFEVSVNVGNLRGIRVYVTGFSAAPGAYTVSNLSTLLNLFLVSGGPSSGGSFRDIHLIRGGKTISEFDLYSLLLRGDKTKDLLLQPEDVIHVGPIGPQVAIAGAVGRPAVYEIKAKESVKELLSMAGGLSSAADSTLLRILEIDRRDLGFREIPIADGNRLLKAGDVYLAVNLAVVDPPSFKRNLRVRIAGEVMKPGEYLLPPGAELDQAISTAGGLAPFAYMYGTILSRESSRREQETQLKRVRQELEQSMLVNAARAPQGTPEDNLALERTNATLQTLLNRLSNTVPTGRVVLGIQPRQTSLPHLSMEDGDVLYIPKIPEVIGVFGSVTNPGVFAFQSGMDLEAIFLKAGGANPSADKNRVLVVRANGAVEPFDKNQSGLSRLWRGSAVAELLPGDTIYVPEDLTPRVSLTKELRDWTQILSQFALGAAAIQVLRK